jgi:hypothetical protein
MATVSTANVNAMINSLDLTVQKSLALLIAMETDSASKANATVKMGSSVRIAKLKAAPTLVQAMENVTMEHAHVMKDLEEKIVA